MDKAEERDPRIEDARAVKVALELRGVKVLQREWAKVKDQAFADLTNETLADDTLKARQTLFNQISEWVDIPNQIIKKGEDAEEEKKEPERETNAIKRAVNFVGRRG